MRNISFALTTAQIRAQTKTVTRRIGWKFLKPGDLLMACEKCQGIKKGGLVRLGVIRVVRVSREKLEDFHQHDKNWRPMIVPSEASREGFPKMTSLEFINMFCAHMECEPSQIVTRIEFEY